MENSNCDDEDTKVKGLSNDFDLKKNGLTISKKVEFFNFVKSHQNHYDRELWLGNKSSLERAPCAVNNILYTATNC